MFVQKLYEPRGYSLWPASRDDIECVGDLYLTTTFRNDGRRLPQRGPVGTPRAMRATLPRMISISARVAGTTSPHSQSGRFERRCLPTSPESTYCCAESSGARECDWRMDKCVRCLRSKCPTRASAEGETARRRCAATDGGSRELRSSAARTAAASLIESRDARRAARAARAAGVTATGEGARRALADHEGTRPRAALEQIFAGDRAEAARSRPAGRWTGREARPGPPCGRTQHLLDVRSRAAVREALQQVSAAP